VRTARRPGRSVGRPGAHRRRPVAPYREPAPRRWAPCAGAFTWATGGVRKAGPAVVYEATGASCSSPR
jgi:hypothetical protein